jgi:hypothetical protein
MSLSQTSKMLFKENLVSILIHTVDPVYSERVGAAKSVRFCRVFTINVFNLTTN